MRTGEPFTVLYGPGVGDVFVDATGEVRTMEQALWHMLRAAGFERIAFSTLHDPVYFRDDASWHRSRRPARRTPGTDGRAGRPGMRHAGLRGPLGGTRLLGAGPAPGPERPAAPDAGAARASGIADPFGVMTLTAYLRGTGHRTAVVFPHADEFLLHNQASRQLAQALAAWASDGVEGNQWVLAFNRTSLHDVAAFLTGLGRCPGLETFVTERRDEPARRGTHRVGLPGERELERLVDAARLRTGLRVAWRDLDRVVRAMAGQPETARVWRSRLHQLHARGAQLDRDTSVPGWARPPPRNAPRGNGWPPCPARKTSYAASRGCAPRWRPRPHCAPGAAPPKANHPHGTSCSPATRGPARPPWPASSARCTGTWAC
ncbi:hypothetical protein ACW23B_01810 [Streptomyces albidoflavus]